MQITMAHYGHFSEGARGYTCVLPQRLDGVRSKMEDEAVALTDFPIDCPREEAAFIKKIALDKALEAPLIFKALNLIKKSHAGQRRQSGEPFYFHPVAVATIVLDFAKTSRMVVAALLHDVVEDSHASLAQIAFLFGDEVASLVDQLTKFDGKLTKVKLSSAENYHKLINGHQEATQIKLADRLHNMRTIGSLSPEKQRRKAEESLRYYIPLAGFYGKTLILDFLKFSH